MPHAPGLTPAGRLAEILGFLSSMSGLYLDLRPLLVLGLVLLVPVAYAFVAVWIQSASLTVEVHRPGLARALEPSAVQVSASSGIAIPSILIHDAQRPRLGAVLHLERLKPRVTCRGRTQEVYARRGHVRPGPLTVHCSRPLGLACSNRLAPARSDLVVLPCLGSLRGPLAELVLHGQLASAEISRQRGFGGDLRCMRPYLPGDSHRHIHWPTTARMGETMVREWDAEEDQGLLVVGIGWRPTPSLHQRGRVELAVSLLATMLHRARRPLLILLPHAPGVRVGPHERAARERAERGLALLEEDAGWPEFEQVSADERVCGQLLIHTGTCTLPALPADVSLLDVSEVVARGEFFPRGGIRA